MDLKQKADAEFTGGKYTSIFKGKFNLPNSEEKVDKKTLRWSYFKQMESGEMLSHVQTKVFPFLKQLNGEKRPYARHMGNAIFMIPKPSLLTEAISIIDNIYIEIEKESKRVRHFTTHRVICMNISCQKSLQQERTASSVHQDILFS